MHTFVKRALWGAAIAGGMTLLGATAASAAETGGEDGILSGTQLDAPISVPVEIAGNAISILGTSTVETPAAAAPEAAAEPQASATDGTAGVASGTQALVEVTAPVTVGGNAIAVLGGSSVTGTDSAVPAVSGTETGPAPGAATDGSDSLLGGTQLVAPVEAPVSIGTNAISLLGQSAVSGESAGGTAVEPATAPTAQLTSGLDGLLGGSQIALPVSVPLAVGGNSIPILGQSAVTGTTPAPGTNPGPVPGVDPGPVPGTDPGTGPSGSAVLPRAAATGTAGMLATTGGAGLLPAAVAGLGLLGLGGALLRRRPV